MQRSSYKELLIYRAWGTCGPPDFLRTKFDVIPQNIMLSVEVCQRTSKAVYIMKFQGELA